MSPIVAIYPDLTAAYCRLCRAHNSLQPGEERSGLYDRAQGFIHAATILGVDTFANLCAPADLQYEDRFPGNTFALCYGLACGDLVIPDAEMESERARRAAAVLDFFEEVLPGGAR